MKKLIISAVFLAFSGIAAAQQDGEVDQDKIQQEPPRETRTTVERAAQRDAKSNKSESDFKAEQEAKDKSRTQKQTTAEPVKSNKIEPPKEPKPQVKPTKQRN